ncbi:uncharacterized protein LOC117642822 [Thrips palmi]|uniref:Uncharacterized protein LOC117642822 n=1 Tax=Thrips palmi TaxID=161013 RepID=A0A6P8YCA4_THRPL|nr:uncharacterized protein LOC117642822 [Thrips palmi]
MDKVASETTTTSVDSDSATSTTSAESVSSRKKRNDDSLQEELDKKPKKTSRKKVLPGSNSGNGGTSPPFNSTGHSTALNPEVFTSTPKELTPYKAKLTRENEILKAKLKLLSAKMKNKESEVHICCVHTERNMKKGAKGDPNKDEALKSFRKMLYAENDEDFQLGLKEFINIAGKPLKDYFISNWLNLKESWCLKDRALVTTLKIHSPNHTESKNQKLKLAMDANTPLYDAVDILVNTVQGNRKDNLRYRDHLALAKEVYVNNCSDPLFAHPACNELTEFPAKQLCEQFQLAQKPSPVSQKYDTSSDKCSCIYFKTMSLTCRHIMRLRKSAGLSWYSKDIIPTRWHKEYNMGWWKQHDSLSTDTLTIQPRMPGKSVKKILAPAEKFHEVAPTLKDVQSLVVNNSGTMQFHERHQLLKDIHESWAKGETVQLVHLSGPNKEPFTLKSVKTTGRPRGLHETIHDGSKKSSTLNRKSKAPLKQQLFCRTKLRSLVKQHKVCSSCKREGGSYQCTVCQDFVHGLPPCSVRDSREKFCLGKGRLCKSCANDMDASGTDQGNDNADSVAETLTTAADSKTKQDSLSAQSKICCTCYQEAGSHQCTICQESVHAIEPCSIRDPNIEDSFGKGRICKSCADDMDASDTDKGGDNADTEAETLTTAADPTTEQDSLYEQPNICCTCDQETGSNRCTMCQEFVHSVQPCSIRNPNIEDGFVKGRICKSCADDMDASGTDQAS